MADVKNKVVTVESLSALHEHNKENFMNKVDPIGSGTMTMNGSADFSGNVNVGSFMIGSKVKLVPTENALEIVFLDEETIEEG